MTQAELSPAKRALLERRLRGGASTPPRPVIPPRQERGTAPLSPMQQRLWFLDQFRPGEAFATIDYALRMTGWVDEDVLERTVNLLMTRHEPLRTAFVQHNGCPRQIILAEAHAPLQLVDLRRLDTARAEAEVLRLATEQARQPFDLTSAPLLRTTLVRLGPLDHAFLVTMHHIVSDGWSMRIFFEELQHAYLAMAVGREPDFAPLAIQYADFAEWQQRRLEGGLLDAQLNYWRRQLAGVQALELPLDRPRPSTQTFVGATHVEPIPVRMAARASELGRRHDATLFMTLLAVFIAQLRRYTEQDDLAIGTYITGRGHLELEPLIGFFVNVLVLRTRVDRSASFLDLLVQVRETAIDAYANQEVPFEKLVEELHPTRDPSRNPLCQVAFQVFTPPQTRAVPTRQAALLPVERGTANFDLALSIAEDGDGLCAEWEYNTDLFEAATVARMARHYLKLLDGVVENPGRPLEGLTLLSPEERHLVTEAFTTTRANYPVTDGIASRFVAVATHAPDATAFLYTGGRLTYGALLRDAGRLAHRLREAGVGPGVVVGVHLERTPDLPAVVIAVLLAGAVLLPLEPSYPEERLQHMVHDSRAALVVTAGTAFRHPGVRIVDLDAERVALAARPDAFAPVPVGLDAPACVIYTSGSTGRPKPGVLSHRTVLNRLAWMWEAYPLTEDDVSCQKTLLSFVDALWELLGPLLDGRPTLLVPGDAIRDPEALVTLLAEHHVTRIWAVPAQLRAMLDVPGLGARLPDLRLCVLGGDVVPRDLQRNFAASVPHARLLNSYGTSELWDVTFYDPDRDGAVEARSMPIGRPIGGVRAYVLDLRMQPQAVGVPGELYVGGAAVGPAKIDDRGRAERPLVADPFSDASGAVLYRTGNLVRWLPNGCLEFLGRRDDQFKLRGFRIEPAEIEATLRQQPGVRDAAVVVRRTDRGEPQLVACYVGEEPSVASLRRALRTRLPEPMVPTAWARLDALPMTPSRKVDRHALAAVAPTLDEQDRVPPRTDLEYVLAEIWADIIGTSAIGVHDSFFDVGGHSLLATRVMSRISSLFRVELSVRTLFEAPTIGQLAVALLQDPEQAARVQRVAAVARRVDAMSDEEVRTILVQRSSGSADGR